MVKTINTKTEFDEVIKENEFVVVDFFATWCGPCRIISPKVEEMSKEYTNVTFIKVDVDVNSETAETCQISAMPTFHFYKDGHKVDEVVGASEEKLKKGIQKLVA